MSKKRRQHSAQFKAQVGLDALKGIEPVHAIAAKHGVHPVQVSNGRRRPRSGCRRYSPASPTRTLRRRSSARRNSTRRSAD
jgi:transposase-like protein